MLQRELLLNDPDDYLKCDASCPTSGWERKICTVSVWRLDQNCSNLQGALFSRMMIDLHPFPVSVSVSALPVTRRGSIPHNSGNCREQAKHCDWSSPARAETQKQQQLDGTRHLNEWGWELLRDISKQTLEGWDWSWQMSKSWPKMNALINTHIQMYEVMKLRDL